MTQENGDKNQVDLIESMMAGGQGQTPNFEELMGGENSADFMNALQSLMMANGAEGEEGDAFDFGLMMQEMMQQFVSKDALYEPCKEIIPKYEEYLSTHTDLSAEDRAKYTAQKEAYEELLQILETDEHNQGAIMEAVEKVNSLGEPPAEIQPEDAGAPADGEAPEGCAPQ